MKFTPINNRYLVKVIEIEKKPGSIIIINEVSKQPIYEIVEGYEGAEFPTGIRCIIMKYKGQEIELENNKYIIVHEEDIIAIIE